MPSRTNTDRIIEAEKEIARLSADFNNALQRLSSVEDSLRIELRRLADTVGDLAVKFSANDIRTGQLERLLDESRTRKWQVQLAFTGCLLSAVVALVVAFVKR